MNSPPWHSGWTIHINIFVILQNLFIMLCLFSESDQLELPQYHNKVTCLNTKCYFCTETHSTFACPTPYCYCADNHCWVPLSHSNHGLVCPAQVNDIDMTEVRQANCNYFDDLLDYETSVAASF